MKVTQPGDDDRRHEQERERRPIAADLLDEAPEQ